MSPGVECLTLDRESFKQHIGDLEELHEKDYGDSDRIYSLKQIENRQIRLFDQEREIERGRAFLTISLIGISFKFYLTYLQNTQISSSKI